MITYSRLLVFAVAGLLVACETDDSQPTAPVESTASDGFDDGCRTNENLFEDVVYGQLLGPVCSGCHNPWGVAKETDLVLVPLDAPEALHRNFQALEKTARLDIEGLPLVVAKPSGATAHQGGVVLDSESPEYAALLEIVQRIRDGEEVECEVVQVEENALFDGVLSLGPGQTLRKATIHLAGRLPTQEEYDLVESGGWAAYDVIMGRVLREDAFYDVLREIFNDLLLTDKYLEGREALQLLDKAIFPDAEWMFADDAYQRAEGDEEALQLARTHANRALAREPLELIDFIVRRDRPFTEILTADYTILNPFSATVYGLDRRAFEDPYDPDEYAQSRLPGVPHAGILTSAIFLNRYPTTDTNRNRHRARMVYDYFLGVDVLTFAQRPIDLTSPTHNPTMNDPQCNVCHEVVDPVAGAFKNWDDQGSYRVPEAWHGDMLPPGFLRRALPLEEGPKSLQWLAREITEDPRFDGAIARIVYRGLTGDDPLEPPQPDETHGAALRAAFDAQTQFFERVGQSFRANGHDIRVVFKEITKSPWFRAVDFEGEADDARLAQLGVIGLQHPLTPEGLNRTLNALFPYPWRSQPDDIDYLTNRSQYRMLYGGIDSDDIIKRLRDPNGIMANIQWRMANEIACRVVARDFGQAPEDRRLFPTIERTFVPEDDNGFAIEAAADSLKDAVVHLHRYILNEDWDVDDREIEATWLLWQDVWRTGRDGVIAGELLSALPSQCRYEREYWSSADIPADDKIVEDPEYTVRAWMAVISYLLLDYRFLYQ